MQERGWEAESVPRDTMLFEEIVEHLYAKAEAGGDENHEMERCYRLKVVHGCEPCNVRFEHVFLIGRQRGSSSTFTATAAALETVPATTSTTSRPGIGMHNAAIQEWRDAGGEAIPSPQANSRLNLPAGNSAIQGRRSRYSGPKPPVRERKNAMVAADLMEAGRRQKEFDKDWVLVSENGGDEGWEFV